MSTADAWTDATKRWAAHHDATNPARPPAGELTEPERLRYIAQARRLGREVERLRAENEVLRAALLQESTDGWHAGNYRVDL